MSGSFLQLSEGFLGEFLDCLGIDQGYSEGIEGIGTEDVVGFVVDFFEELGDLGELGLGMCFSYPCGNIGVMRNGNVT